jgi:hypothetical protein
MPNRHALPIACLLLSAVTIALAAEPTTDELTQITARGRLLAQYDQAAWHSTDAVMAMKPDQGALQRYIARETPSGWVVAYGRLNEKQDKFLVVYEATQAAGLKQFTVKKVDPPREDSGFYFLGAKAVDTALADFHGQRRPYNAMVLPHPSGQIYVYVVPAQTKTGVYPLGGDVRYLIATDGTTIVEKHQMHQSILDQTLTLKADEKPVAGVHTHILSDVPEDSDVLYVLIRQPSVPEMIVTGNRRYQIETDGTIKMEKK